MLYGEAARQAERAGFSRIVTYKRGVSLDALADRGRPYAPVLARPDLVQFALSETWNVPIRVDPRTWELPAGAHGDATGPS